jgi:molybdopterin-biosynthesis enzyme MoeA-like protein
VIADDEAEIIEAATRMSRIYDLVVTSGGIGPTHDDITYPSISKAFDAPLALHAETAEKMRRLARKRAGAPPFDWDTPRAALTARMRMAMLPSGEKASVVFVNDDLWVPICVVNRNVHILPGVPRIFMQLLDGLRPLWEKEGVLPSAEERSLRVIIATPLPESDVAEFLTSLQERVSARGVKVGSYPRWGKSTNSITLVGSDREYIESLIPEVEKATDGKRVLVEGENDRPMSQAVEEVVEKAVEGAEKDVKGE